MATLEIVGLLEKEFVNLESIIVPVTASKFGQIGTTIVLLLYGGDKSTQAQDIRKAQEYWRDYERREDADQ